MDSEYARVLENKEDRQNIYSLDSKGKFLFLLSKILIQKMDFIFFSWVDLSNPSFRNFIQI